MKVKDTKDALRIASDRLSKSFEKLSSGKRINSAADDPAGLALAESLKNDAALYSRGSRNSVEASLGNDIAQSALSQVNNIATRMAELAQQSANGVYSDDQRQALNNEYQQLQQEIDRIADTTTFNGQKLLEGGSGVTAQVGTDSSANSQIQGVSVDLKSLNVSGNISNQEQARVALDQVKTLVGNVSKAAGEIGAVNNRLKVAENNNNVAAENAKAAESRIRDVDIASEMANKVSSQILQKSATALQAQANQTAQVALKLLS